jgi:hypothetical protein
VVPALKASRRALVDHRVAMDAERVGETWSLMESLRHVHTLIVEPQPIER